MGTQFVDGSPGLGSIFSNIAGAFEAAPGKALSNIHVAETIKDQRIKRMREEEEYQAAQGAIKAFPDTLQKEVAPSTMQTVGPFTGDPTTDPGVTAGLPIAQVDYIDPRKQAQLDAYNQMAIAAQRQAALKGQVNTYGPLAATAIVGGGGVPTDLNERNRVNFLANNKFMSDAERALPAAHNMVIKGPNDEIIDQFSTRNGVTTEDGRRLVDIRAKMTPDQKLLASGAASTELPNPLKSEGDRLKLLSDYTAKIAGSGYTMTVPEAIRAAQALEAQYGTENKIQSDGYGRIAVFKNFQAREIPGLHGRLAEQINQVLGGATAAAVPVPGPGATAAPPAPVVTTGPRPITTEIVSDAASDKADAAAMVALSQVKQAKGEMLAQLGADANGQLPPSPRVPNWGAALANEKLGGTVAGNNLVNAVDPSALAYFQTAKRVVEPILRLASGAAINKGEYADYYQMFIPAQGDTPQMMANKLNALRVWQTAVAESRTANGLLRMAESLGQGNPVIQTAVERMRVKTLQGGRGNTPFVNLPPDAGGGGGGSSVIDDAAAIVNGTAGRR